jgi:DNA repair exonuclease SbcCD ATPase subunit
MTNKDIEIAEACISEILYADTMAAEDYERQMRHLELKNERFYTQLNQRIDQNAVLIQSERLLMDKVKYLEGELDRKKMECRSLQSKLEVKDDSKAQVIELKREVQKLLVDNKSWERMYNEAYQVRDKATEDLRAIKHELQVAKAKIAELEPIVNENKLINKIEALEKKVSSLTQQTNG